MNAARLIDLTGGAIVAVILAAVVYNAVFDPLADDRAWLQGQRGADTGVAGGEYQAAADFAAWQAAIAERPAVWSAISPAPAAPKPPPPKPCKPPTADELAQKLSGEGVRFTRAQIGKKVKVVIGNDRRGEFYAEGDSVKGYTVKSFDRTTVVLSTTHTCPDKSTEEIEFTMPRE